MIRADLRNGIIFVILLAFIMCLSACGVSLEDKNGDNVGKTENVIKEDAEKSYAHDDYGSNIGGGAVDSVTMYTTTKVNVSKDPSESADVYMKISAHTEVEVVGAEGKWSKVLLDDNTYYIASEFLKEKRKEAMGI